MIWDLGPRAEGHPWSTALLPTCAPTVLLHLPPPQPTRWALCPSSICGVLPGGLQSPCQPLPCRALQTEPFRPAGKVGERLPLRVSFWRISSGSAFSSAFPNKCPEWELCHHALGTVTFTHLVEGACPLFLLPLETHLQNCILGGPAWATLPPLLWAGALPLPHGQDSSHLGVKQGANTSQPLGPGRGDWRGPRWGTVLSSSVCPQSPVPALL